MERIYESFLFFTAFEQTEVDHCCRFLRISVKHFLKIKIKNNLGFWFLLSWERTGKPMWKDENRAVVRLSITKVTF